MNHKLLAWLISGLLNILLIVPYSYKWIYLSNLNAPAKQISEIVQTYNGWEILFLGQPPFLHFLYVFFALIVSVTLLKFVIHLIIVKLFN